MYLLFKTTYAWPVDLWWRSFGVRLAFTVIPFLKSSSTTGFLQRVTTAMRLRMWVFALNNVIIIATLVVLPTIDMTI
jgi:hypothetical protein